MSASVLRSALVDLTAALDGATDRFAPEVLYARIWRAQIAHELSIRLGPTDEERAAADEFCRVAGRAGA